MNIFHHHLEPIKASCFWDLNLSHESLSKIFKYNTIRSSEESKNMLNEVLLILIEFVPIFKVLSKIDFFSSPKTCHLLFVHLPDIIVINWKDNKSIWIFFKKRLWESCLSLSYLSLTVLSNPIWNL